MPKKKYEIDWFVVLTSAVILLAIATGFTLLTIKTIRGIPEDNQRKAQERIQIEAFCLEMGFDGYELIYTFKVSFECVKKVNGTTIRVPIEAEDRDICFIRENKKFCLQNPEDYEYLEETKPK